MKLIVVTLIVVIFSASAYMIFSNRQNAENDSALSHDSKLKNTRVDQNAKESPVDRDLIISKANSSSIEDVELDEVGDPIWEDAPIISEELEERYRIASDNEQYPTLSSRIAAMTARRPNSNYSPEDILSAIEKSKAWEGKDDPGVLSQKLNSEELNDGRQFLDFDQLKVETLMPGDHMDIAVDAIGQVFDMRVDGVKIFDDGNVMWKGTIVNGEGGTVSITQSSNITVASVVLRQEDYTLESHGSDGWIVDSSVLFKIDPNHTDAVIPPTDHSNH